MFKSLFSFIFFLICVTVFSQETNHAKKRDTTKLEEVIVVSRVNLNNFNLEKSQSSVDKYLEKSNQITMIKRGNYAWETSMNNMTSDRLAITIDGMQIFGACTDKMDPITSYVDVSNLESISVNSGQSGTENCHSIGGGIDLQLPTSAFNNTGLKTNVDLGYETNGSFKTTGLDLEYANTRFYLNADGIYKKSDNYSAGNNTEVLYSQFEKYNVSLQSGIKINTNHSADANVIFDEATNVGYPALTMDVSLAKALITSVSHHYTNDSAFIKTLENKLYFNTITHIMDDSKRPDVPIRMDMPGWSKTYGFYSKGNIIKNKHNVLFNLNGFYNTSFAEMTMYPNDPNQPAMYMQTWPGIRTLYTGIFAKDQYIINPNQTLSTSLRLGYHKNKISEEIGLNSLQIFYPNSPDSKSRILKSVATNYEITQQKFKTTLGIGYGERAPTVSEGYGFYLFNSFDNYDYIGNPTLKNEKALEANFKTTYTLKTVSIGIESAYFHITDYIIGDIDSSLSPMTFGADGVRVYKQLNNATIFDTYLKSSIKASKTLSFNASIGYNYGTGSNNEPLPLIKPFSYVAEINYSKTKFNSSIQLEGNGNQSNYSSFYGEDQTPDFAILNINFGHLFYYKNNKLVFKYGVENILDTHYSTYADWNNIPRQGRNMFFNLSFLLQ